MTTIEILPDPDEPALRTALECTDTAVWEWDFAAERLSADVRFFRLLDPAWLAESRSGTLMALLDDISAHIAATPPNRERFSYNLTDPGQEMALPQPLCIRGAVLERDPTGRPLRAAGTAACLFIDRPVPGVAFPDYISLAMDTASLSLWLLNMRTSEFRMINQETTALGHDPRLFRSFEDILDMVHPEDVSILRNAIRTMRDEPVLRRASLVYRIRNAEGGWSWMHTTVIVIGRDPVTGEVVETFGLNQDVTEFKEAEVALDRANERLQLAMEATRLTLWEWDIPSGVFEVLNERSELLGFDPGADITYTIDFFLGLVHPDDLPLVEKILARLGNRNESLHALTVRMRRQNGEWAWVQLLLSVNDWSHDGKPMRILGIGMDISESMEAELAARQAEQERGIILDSVREAIFHINTDLEVSWLNQNASRLFAELSPPGGDPALAACCVFHEHAPCDACAARTVFATGQPVDLEKDVGGHSYRMLLNPVFGSQGEVRGCVGSVLDITEQRKMERELRHSQKMLAIGQLAGGVAHDFNNRLNSIMGFAQLLSEELSQKDPALRDFADRIVAASKRAAALTRQLLAFARKGQYRLERVDLHALIDEVFLFVEHSFDKRIRIVRETAAANPYTMGDADQIQNALLNLAINARDAMPEGGRLTFRTENLTVDAGSVEAEAFDLAPGAYVCVQVVDTGGGIAPEVAPHVFEPFFTTKPVGEGTGMGLASAYGTVKKHGGGITFRSGPEGTVFRVCLPAAAAAVAAESGPVYGQGRGRILAIDDDEQLLALFSAALSKDGYSVVTATNGTDGVKAFRNDPLGFDIVIIDMVMPDLSGVEVYEAIRRLRPRQRALVCSGYICEEQVAKLEPYPQVDFVKKPFSVQVIRDMMASATS